MKIMIEIMRQQKAKLALIILTALLQVFGTLLVPYYVKEIIDSGIARENISAIVSIGLRMLAAATLTALIALWSSYLSADLAALAGQRIRDRLFDKTQTLSITDFNRFGTSSLITRTTGDIAIIQQTAIMFIQMILPAPLISLAALFMTALISPRLLIIPLLTMVVFILASWWLFMKSRPVSETLQPRVDAINRIVGESLKGIRVIRAFDNAGYEQRRSDNAFEAYAENVIRLNRIFAVFNPVVWMIIGIVMAAVFWFGGYLVLDGALEVGGITAVSEYTMFLLFSLMMCAMVLVMVPKMMVSLARIQEVLDTVPEIMDTDIAERSGDGAGRGTVVFDQVGFAYKGAEQSVLAEISFTCEPGKTTAVIGGTGSGKSTVAGLMLRLYEVQTGSIRFAGQDIRDIPQHVLRDSIGYIPQKAALFSGTIADNLRVGHPQATLAEIRHAAQIAQADTFISSLPQGYDSPVAQDGTNLSGGQKQRLCIARALVKQAPVYLFDDSFSALDYRTDLALRQALKREMRNAAVVIIAQRISTIMDADQIIVLDGGRIAGIGKHQELLNACNVYREIAQSQLTQEGESVYEEA